LCAHRPLSAHDLARSESRLKVQGAVVECQLIVDLLGFPAVDDDGNGAVSYAELDRSIAAVFARVKEHFRLRSPAEPSKILMTRHELVDEHTARLMLEYTFPARLSELEVTATFDRLTHRPDHQHFVIATIGGVEERAVLDAGHSTVTFDRRWWTRTSVWLTLAGVVLIGLRAAWFFRARRPPLLR
jgi:LPXTG-motif cell wall-anchored protein